ncbi:MAG: DUF2281 domain-containing protein [Anaerolineales bacterium]|nr:DUF2281 domain-containing protein [Anaerolineales bacterium]
MTLMEQIQKQIRQLPPESQREVLDFVTFLQLRPRQQLTRVSEVDRQQRIKKSLTQLARMKVFSDIADPVEWQRQIRKDRLLPGRST